MTLGNMRANGVRSLDVRINVTGCLWFVAVQYFGRGRGLRSSPVSELDPRFRVAVRASADGRFTFQIFTLSGEPRTFHADSQTYATPADAAQAGYDAIAAAQYRKS
jgi:hypothetical protein